MPSHYLNQYWNIVNLTLWNKVQWNLNRNSYLFIQENAFENIVWKCRPFCLDLNIHVLIHGFVVCWDEDMKTCSTDDFLSTSYEASFWGLIPGPLWGESARDRWGHILHSSYLHPYLFWDKGLETILMSPKLILHRHSLSLDNVGWLIGAEWRINASES